MRFASIIFDFDSTLVSVETFDLICEVALEGARDKEERLAEFKRITKLGMEGAVSFDESLSRRMQLIKLTRAHIEKIAKRITDFVTPSFLNNRDFLQENSDRLYVISGGFEECIFPVSDLFSIPREHVFANRFIFEGNLVSGVDAKRETARAGGKAKTIDAANLPNPRVIIGDGWTDYEIKKAGAAELFVAYVEHANRPIVAAAADKIARSFGDLMSYL